MNRVFLHNPLICLVITVMAVSGGVSAAESENQFYEIRTYILGENGDLKAIDQYLSEALLPALARQNVGPVGVFTNSANDASGSPRVVVVIPYNDPSQLNQVSNSVEADSDYQSAAENYLQRGSKDPAYERVSSELLVAMDCMPKLNVPSGTLQNSDRVYELRLYESGNERLGNLKVDMFNNGEVPIFLDCGIQPILIGQCVIGPQMPSLTYLTVYPNEDARLKAWQAFRKHPDWQVLKEVAKYKGTVSHIDKYVLVPKPYSQM